MRKHFLFLMLMSILPLVGWAQTATLGDVGIGKFTYGDTEYPTPVVKDSEGAILTVTTHYTVSTEAYTDEACTVAVSDKKNLVADGTKYYLKITGAGAYVGQQKAVYFTVSKCPITLTYEAGALNRTYGEAPVALVESKFTCSTPLKYGQNWADVKKGSMPTGYTTADNNAGTGKAVTFVGGWTADNYEISYSATLNIAAKDISSTATIAAEQGDVVYTGKAIAGVYTVKDADIVLTQGTKDDGTSDFYVSTQKDVIANFKPTITFQGNYTGSITATTGFAVTPAPITVSIADIETTYNTTDQQNQKTAAKFSYSGIVGDDITNATTIKAGFDASSATVTVGSEAIDAGKYTLTIAGVTAGSSTNYKIKNYLPGKLTIKPIELSIKANDTAKNLGDADPTFTLASVAGLISGHKVTDVTFTREEGEVVGSYDITPVLSAAKVKSTDGKKDFTKNYTFKVATPKGQLVIGQGAIVVTIKDAEKYYGQADPEFTYVVTGLQSGDKLAAFTITRADKNEAVGGYSLSATVANPDADKYTSVTVVPGILTINKAPLSFTIPAQNVEIGDDESALKKDGITVAGIYNSDVAADLYDLSINGSTAADATIASGIYATLTTAAQACYEILSTSANYVSPSIASGKLIVGKGTTAAINFTSVDGDYTTILNQAGETQTVTLDLSPRNTQSLGDQTRTWAAKQWNTLVLPFDITVADLSKAFGYAIVNVVDATKTTENNVQFKLEMDEIPANTPFTIKTAQKLIGATEAITADGKISFGTQKIVAPTAADLAGVDAGMDYKFVPVYTTEAVDKSKSAYRFLTGDLAKWAQIGSTSAATWNILPFAAYVDLTAAAAPELVTFTFQELDGSYTTIKAVEAGLAKANGYTMDGWYNLNGVKLQGAPTEKGVYINNGKKVVIK